MKRLIIREIESDRKKYGDKRRTLIEEAEKAIAEQKITDEPVTVIVSRNGWIRQRIGHGLNHAGISFKSGDSLFAIYECRSTDLLLAFSSTGRIYTVPVHQLPAGRGNGMPITTFAETGIDETIVRYFVGTPDTTVLVALDSGYGFSARVSDMASRVRNGKSFINLEPGETLLDPVAISPEDKWIATLSGKGRLLLFGIAELRALSSGGHGVILMALENGEKLKAARPVGDKGCLVVCTARNDNRYDVRITGNIMDSHTGKRARKGKAVESRFTPVMLENIK